MGPKTFQRNQLIMLASLNGATTKELARHFNLAAKSIIEIIRNERHRLAVSPHPTYRALRKSGVRGLSPPQ
jgi:Mor family transcriptional regulator